MNPIVRHIIIYSAGLVSGVLLTLFIVKSLAVEEEKPRKQTVQNYPDGEIKRDTVEKVVYKKPKNIQKKNVVEPVDTVSGINDTLIYFENDDTLDININKETLIATRTFKVINISLDSTESNALRDSLEKDLGIQKEKNIKSIKVEFWKSPLNFEGYILGKNLVRLYGVSELENLSFYSLDKKIYMRNSSGTFALIRSEEYHKFELSKEGIDDKILQISRNG